MQRRTIGVLVVVALVAVAGCSGLTGSDDPTETTGATDATTGTDAAAGNGTSTGSGTTTGNGGSDGGPTLADVAYPEGVSEGGFVNASAAALGHATALSETGFAVTLSQATTEGNQSRNLDYEVRSDPDAQRTAGTLNASSYRNQWYDNATHRHARTSTTDGVQVQERRTDFSRTHRQETLATTVRSVLTSGNYSAVETVERNGETAVRYELDEYNASASEGFEAEQASGTVVVGESGIIYEATLSATGTTDAGEASLDLAYEVTEIGDVEVERPDWVDGA
ncbi:hypothetical protein [Halostella litorea]|uniref:hypothetical protein n=1 Tax=Halostella litorea TaxID=2528831 RepID=UPI0010931579|nr:hypothetical protein [Halostella litorea]